MGFLKGIAWDAARYIAVNEAVKGAYRGFDAVKNYRGTPMPAPVYDNDGNAVPLSDRRIFGTPGASLFDAHELGVEAREAGIAGEQRVAQELELLAAFYPNMYVFHSVKLPGRNGDIDHIVVQGDKMMLIDSKNWRGDAAYHVYAATPEGDHISRNGENFIGGEIHLRRQMADWQSEFGNSHLQVNATLVVANRTASVSEAVNAPYSFANIDGLAHIFSNVFYQAAVPPLHPELLNHLLSMVHGMEMHSSAAAPVSRPAATTGTKLLVAWSVFNWTVMWLLFPLAGFSALPLLLTTHLHKAKVKHQKLGGNGLLTTVLVFTYVQLALWALFAVYAIQNGGIPGVVEWS